MAQQTTNLHLTKPDLTDFADVRVLNQNFDILDEKVQEALDKDPDLSGLMPKSGGNFTGDITVLEKPVVSIIETITDDNGYCIKYSNGYMEQHYRVRPTTAQFYTLNFLAPFYDTNYIIGTCGEKQDIGEYGSFVDYVGETLGATQPNKVMTTSSVTLSYHYSWAFGDMNKQKIMVNIWGRWK